MRLKKETKLYGIFGYPLAHTLSPAMQEAAFRQVGLKHFYLTLELNPTYFRKTMKALRRLNLEGFNITVPYKEKVISYLNRVSPQAKAVGAVNTVFRKKGKWHGTNTDVDGFLTSLAQEGRFNPKGKRVLVLGAGGAARAAVYALAKKSAKSIVIANRTLSRGKKIIRDFQKLFPRTKLEVLELKAASVRKQLQMADLVVNTTSLGLKPSDKKIIQPSWIPRAKGRNKILFYDLIYHVPLTPLLKAAKAKKHKTLNGLGMLLHQGAHAFEIWTRKKAPLSIMRSTLEANLK